MWLSFCKENREKPLSFLCKTRSRKECFHIQSTRHTPLRRRRKKSFGVVVPPPLALLPCLSNTFGGGMVSFRKEAASFIVLPFVGFLCENCILLHHFSTLYIRYFFKHKQKHFHVRTAFYYISKLTELSRMPKPPHLS